MANTNPTLREFTPRKMDLKRKYHLSALVAALRLPIIEDDAEAIAFRNYGIKHHLSELTRFDTKIPSSGANLELMAFEKIRLYGMDIPIVGNGQKKTD